jgi:hypothetical protein
MERVKASFDEQKGIFMTWLECTIEHNLVIVTEARLEEL